MSAPDLITVTFHSGGGWRHDLTFAAADMRAILDGRSEPIRAVHMAGFQEGTINTYEARLGPQP